MCANLSIGFGCGPEFATPTEFIRSGFRKVEAGLKLPWYVRGHLYIAFEVAHRSGAARGERDAVAKVLTGCQWSWPWLEKCASDFDNAKIWPQSWIDVGIACPLRWVDVPDLVRFTLLGETLATAAYRARDFSHRRESVQFGGNLTLIVGDDRCPVERRFAAQHRPFIEAGDYNTLPPFFPGDGCHLLWNIPRRRSAGASGEHPWGPLRDA